MRVVVDTERGVAPWRQVHEQITHAIASGALPPGSRLPAIRQLARDLALATGTVARAYRELETTGWVHTGRARGTVVTEQPRHPAPQDLLDRAAADFARTARELGADADAAVIAVRSAYRTSDVTGSTDD
ncbi:GntR family transcriptional regulator [Amycolatopsis antarctica]|uniref:GntR family transcriptional regulator n=1 Tax=Amycolatopsis antarctica TaxID=1854586 RepID=A0A263CW54_9PSEU|nr:GntR family transcriptional regulator [Amycolatopsis antarctica]